MVVGLVLIVSAVQAITPDAHDIASPFVIKLFVARQAEDDDFRDEDRLPDQVCLAVHPSESRLAGQQHAAAGVAPDVCSGRPSFEGFADKRGPLRPAFEIRPGPELYEALCRLVC